MTTDTMDEPIAPSNRLGAYLKARRSRLDPVALGFPAGRRRTPGLRREEVAARADISATWYTWLEQGRGGAPSAEVLERIATALMLTEVEREHLFLLAFGHAPKARRRASDAITPRLQRVLDRLEPAVALIRTAAWDVVAWNRAARVVMTDYAAAPDGRHNILRHLFGDASVRARQLDWEAVARFVVASFRADMARAGVAEDVAPLVAELRATSPDFDRFWRDHDVLGHGGGLKRLRHPELGEIELEYSTFAVDGRSDLTMIVYNPITAEDAARIAALIAASPS